MTFFGRSRQTGRHKLLAPLRRGFFCGPRAATPAVLSIGGLPTVHRRLSWQSVMDPTWPRSLSCAAGVFSDGLALCN
jgi:hypothetical protein